MNAFTPYPPNRRVYRRIVLLQLLAYGSYAPMNYYSVLLKNIGFDSARIGLLGSISSVIAAATLPLWGVLSDKIGSARKMFLSSMVLYAAAFAFLPAAGRMTAYTYIPIYILIVFYSLVRQPTHSLQDAWVLSLSERYGVNFTATRKWGSFGFAVVSVFFGYITAFTGTGATFYAAPILIVPLIILYRDFPREEGGAAPETPAQPKPGLIKIRFRVLFKNYYLMTAFIMTVSLAFYAALVSPFYPFILESAGMDPNQYGVISGYGAFVQVVCMWVISTRCHKTPLTVLLIAGSLAGVAEQIMYGLASGFLMMMIAGTFWGVSMGIYVSTLPTYIHSLVPHTHSATALSLNGTVVLFLTIIGNYAGGLMIASIGVDSYNYVLAALRCALTLLFMLSLFIGKKLLKTGAPQ